MRRLRAMLGLGLLLPMLSSGCRSAVAPAGLPSASKLKVLAVETFIADMAQNVAGDRLHVETLMAVGADPHAFEPTPEDIARVANCQVLIVNGAGFEEWLQKTLANAGGKPQVIEAAAGLQSRGRREGEVAEMSDADLADAMCAQASEGRPRAVAAGAEAGKAAELPAEGGLFDVALTRQGDGSYAGYLQYSASETGDFQIAFGQGRVTILKGAGATALPLARALALDCGGLLQGNTLRLEQGERYVVALSGFRGARAQLLIGPAGGEPRHAGDPHFWLDPNNVIRYVENIRDGLAKADPAGKDTYSRNAEAEIRQLRDLDQWIAGQVKAVPPERRLIVTNHESLGYFADRYGFQIIGTVVPSVGTGASPSAQQLARLEDRIRAARAMAIFLETGTNPQLAQQVAKDTGVKVVSDLYTHSISAAGGRAPTYIAMMKYNTQAIVEALK